MSTHLRVLRHAGLVNERRDGRYRFCSINPDGAATEVIAVLRKLFKSSLTQARSAVESLVEPDTREVRDDLPADSAGITVGTIAIAVKEYASVPPEVVFDQFGRSGEGSWLFGAA